MSGLEIRVRSSFILRSTGQSNLSVSLTLTHVQWFQRGYLRRVSGATQAMWEEVCLQGTAPPCGCGPSSSPTPPNSYVHAHLYLNLIGVGNNVKMLSWS